MAKYIREEEVAKSENFLFSNYGMLPMLSEKYASKIEYDEIKFLLELNDLRNRTVHLKPQKTAEEVLEKRLAQVSA